MKLNLINKIMLFFTLATIYSCGSDNTITELLPITLECDITEDITLTNHNTNGADYIVKCQVDQSSGTMTIEPGVTIEFDAGAGLTISGDGILNAKGISGQPIILKGKSTNTPSWRGIYVNASKANNTMEHVEIHDAGDGISYSQFEGINAAVTFQGRFSMRNSLIKNSGGVGIFSEEALSPASITYFEDNTIEDCASYPIYIKPDLALNIDFPSNTFIGNEDNFVAFHNFVSDRLNTELTLPAIDIPYFIESELDLYAGLTLEAGVDLVMGNNASIKIISSSNPYLTIQGTQSNHVTIRGKEATSKYWKGILINEANAKNIFEYLDISDGGSETLGFSDQTANITLEFGGELTMTNCTSARSGSNCDVVVSSFGGVSTLNNDSEDIEVCEE